MTIKLSCSNGAWTDPCPRPLGCLDGPYPNAVPRSRRISPTRPPPFRSQSCPLSSSTHLSGLAAPLPASPPVIRCLLLLSLVILACSRTDQSRRECIPTCLVHCASSTPILPLS